MEGVMTRAEHLVWCKRRANECVNQGDLNEAFASFTSDLGKHDGTLKAQELQTSIGLQLLIGGHLKTAQQMREWIDGFN